MKNYYVNGEILSGQGLADHLECRMIMENEREKEKEIALQKEEEAKKLRIEHSMKLFALLREVEKEWKPYSALLWLLRPGCKDTILGVEKITPEMISETLKLGDNLFNFFVFERQVSIVEKLFRQYHLSDEVDDLINEILCHAKCLGKNLVSEDVIKYNMMTFVKIRKYIPLGDMLNGRTRFLIVKEPWRN